MSKKFIWEPGWLVEKPEMQEPEEDDFRYTKGYQQFYIDVEEFDDAMNDYDEYKKSLRRFKYDYPDPGKEMELGKDFEVMINHLDQKEWRAIPITQRTYSEQDLLDVWDAARMRTLYNQPSVLEWAAKIPPDKEQFFKRFGIEIK